MLLMVIGNLGYAACILLEALNAGQTPCRPSHGVSQNVITIFLLVFVTQLILAWIGRSVLLDIIVCFFFRLQYEITDNE